MSSHTREAAVTRREDFLNHYHFEIDLSQMAPEEKASFYKQWKELTWIPNHCSCPKTRPSGTWKHITCPGTDETDELNNLLRNPHEIKNLFSDSKCAIVKNMKRRLAQPVAEARQ